nr:integrase, catalytic region, zinc finger, CCHC-type, peptidase aspartic, catalytic [Tanacetum cinerariifolium]
MTTLADIVILSGSDNSQPILEKDMYDSWKSRMELYMMNRQHGQMILEFVKHGPLIWPTIEENGVTRLRKYSKLIHAEAISSGMYKHEKKQNTNTNKAKSVSPSTKLRAASSVRGPSYRDSSFKNSILANTKNSSEKVEVSDRNNKKPDVASKNIALNKMIVTDVDVKNSLKAKVVLCVSCVKNVLISCHAKCLKNYKMDVHSKVRRTLFTTPITVKSKFENTTLVVLKTRFSVKTTQSKSLDTTPEVSKTKIAVEGLGHNLFIVGQFCDGDLEVAFCSKTCYVLNLEGDDLLTGARESNLYIISIFDMAAFGKEQEIFSST